MNYIANIFYIQAVQVITAVPTVPSDQNDILRWILFRDGRCSTKNIYRHLRRQTQIQLPQLGSKSITQHANFLLQKAWKSKDLQPLIKTFTWTLIRRALATRERASRYCVHIDEHCSVCGAVENDAHLFFHCHLPRGSPLTHPSELTVFRRNKMASNLSSRLYCPSTPLTICSIKY